mgnify:CR=1 FL=1
MSSLVAPAPRTFPGISPASWEHPTDRAALASLRTVLGANVAHALARLGLPTTLLMPLSRDALGERFLTALSAAGVRLPLAASSDMPTSVALVSLQEGQPRYSLYRDGVADRDLRHEQILAALPRHPAVHVLGAFCYAVEPDRSFWLRIADESRRRGALLSSDPNIRAAVMDRAGETPAGMLRALRESDIVKASDEDLAWLFPQIPPHDVAREWSRRHGLLALLTEGAGGVTAFAGDLEIHRPARSVDIVDTVGAGDAFVAAFLSRGLATGVLDGASARDASALADLLDFANAAAALCCARAGADSATTTQVVSFLQSSSA